MTAYNNTLVKFSFNLAAIGLVLASGAQTAAAHVVLQKWEAMAGYQEFVTVAVPHGCGPSATIEVRVKIPDGVFPAVPEQKAGWTTSIVRRKLPQPINGEGGAKITEVIDEVVWSGGSVPTDQLGLFTILARLPDEPGRVLYFKTVQKCAVGETRWIDTLPAGEPIWKIWARPAPSPFLVLQKATRPQLGASMREIIEERKRLGANNAPK
jgi:uncharacterized protein YcnI